MFRLITVWAVLISFITCSYASADEVMAVSIRELKPTQMAAGYAASEASQLKKYHAITTEDALRAKAMQEKPLRAVIGPGGAVYLTDGHHRALGIYRASSAICEASRPQEQVVACMTDVKVRVRVDGNYSKNSWTQFMSVLQKENNIYLNPEAREKVAGGKVSAENIFREPGAVLPPNLGQIANDPMRSAIGTLFYHQGISGDLFANYVEFHLAERVGAAVKVEPGFESDLGVQIKLMKAIFGSPAVVSYLRCMARREKDNWDKAQQQINQAVGIDASVPFEATSCATPEKK